LTFAATDNPVCYEGGEPVFIDTERDTWNMDPKALERAFEIYPDVKLIAVAHLYGTPGKIDEIRAIADKHGALIVEDAAESFGATYKGAQTGVFGDVGVISFNGNKIITGSSGGMILCKDRADAEKARKWSTQSREKAAWYQHTELGYNYRMSNIIAGVVRGQMPYINDHIKQKREIYYRYKEGLRDLPVSMNPFDVLSVPNFWLSCMLIDEDAVAKHERGDTSETWNTEPGKSSPGEILGALAAFGAEGRPIWKPMHMQPVYRNRPFVTKDGEEDVGADIFRRGLCLPSDNKMTKQQQDIVIDIIHRCFK
ncbi:MAG: DegT/DnrJ/EryC1/StrS family aminotransferase, partial [Clostridia bacterium]|nr:DegT/DnrJ/EryC1/StrS family aminotransferase [Clostridia bacterium]